MIKKGRNETMIKETMTISNDQMGNDDQERNEGRNEANDQRNNMRESYYIVL